MSETSVYIKLRGFTIVELLIVIVVIAILAAISIVAYNGMQTRARNNQTITAVNAWAKAVKLYTADKGTVPPWSACLGAPYGYGPNGSDASGFQCRQDNATVGINTVSAFNTAIAEYVGNSTPTPYMKSFVNSATNWYRGAYLYNTSPQRIDFVLEGNVSPCPNVAGMTQINQQYLSTSNATLCAMQM